MIPILLSCVCACLGAGVGSRRGMLGWPLVGCLVAAWWVAAFGSCSTACHPTPCSSQRHERHCVLDRCRFHCTTPADPAVQRREPNTPELRSQFHLSTQTTGAEQTRGTDSRDETSGRIVLGYALDKPQPSARMPLCLDRIRRGRTAELIRRHLGCKARLLQGTRFVPRLACMTAQLASSQTWGWPREGFPPDHNGMDWPSWENCISS